MKLSAKRERLTAQLRATLDSLEAMVIQRRIAAACALPLTPQQVRTVGMIVLNGPTRSSELAGALSISRATMSGLLDRLENAGLITRTTDPSDARGRLAEATELGREALREALASLGPTMDRIVGYMTFPDLCALTKGLMAVQKILREQEQRQDPGA
ncbi:MAG: MarR family transcriptional regulator [Bifidobacteriaceae bacterium]|nr:MarR family transcriptional regulator [Bifidobacteriaceae bacterium]